MEKLQFRLLRFPQVRQATGLSKSRISDLIAGGTFPKQILLGPRIALWAESDIQNWIARRS